MTTKDYLLDLPKTNDILCLTTTETSEPAVNVRRTSWGYAPLFGIHEHWAHVSEIGEAHFQIGAVFINNVADLSFNNYILAWNTRVQCRQALAVAARHVWCRHGVTHISRRNKATSASDRRPSAPWVLLQRWKPDPIRYLHVSYFLPYRSADIFLFCFLSAISIFVTRLSCSLNIAPYHE